MVASRWPQRLPFLAAAIKRSISAVVRYSRVRTEEFTVVGADRRPVCFPTIFCPRSKVTSELSIISSLVSIGAVGILANPGPEGADPYGSAASPDRLTEIRRYRGRAGSSFPFLPRRSALIPSRTLMYGSPWLRASEATRIRRRQINGLGRLGRATGALAPIERFVFDFALGNFIPRRCRWDFCR